MFRALVRHEWRQLRLLRWGTIAVAAVLPAAFVAGAEAARRGIAPLGALEHYTSHELFAELLPAVLMLGLWPLAAIMAGAQAWTGGRASGTETFLLERPVRRGTIWRARLAAAAASFGAAAIGSGAIALAASALAGATIERDAAGIGAYAAAGLAASALALCAVAAAATFVSSPLPALLLGLLLGALPPVLSGVLGGAFPFAAVSGIPVGAVVPWVFVPAFLGASFAALCRGEPAGGGRVRRAATWLGLAAAVAAAAFLAGAPAALAWNASPRRGIDGIDASPTGAGIALVTGDGGSWWQSRVVYDVASGRRTATFPPGLRDLIWNADGRRYAVLTFAGPLGSTRTRMRIEFHELGGGRFAHDLETDVEGFLWRGAWAGDTLLALRYRDMGARRWGWTAELLVVDPAAGTSFVVPLENDVVQSSLQGPFGDGSMIVVAGVHVGSGGAKDMLASSELRVWRFVPTEGRRGLHLVASAPGYPAFGVDGPVSPSGRRLPVFRSVDGRSRPGVIDLGSGAWSPLPMSVEAWAAGDAAVGAEHGVGRARVYVERPDGSVEVAREWSGRGTRVWLRVSPDRKRVLVRVRRMPDGAPAPAREEPSPVWTLEPRSRGEVPELAVYDVAAGAWTRLETPAEAAEDGAGGGVDWAGPDAIARSGPGRLELQEIDRPGSRRVLFGP